MPVATCHFRLSARTPPLARRALPSCCPLPGQHQGRHFRTRAALVSTSAVATVPRVVCALCPRLTSTPGREGPFPLWVPPLMPSLPTAEQRCLGLDRPNGGGRALSALWLGWPAAWGHVIQETLARRCFAALAHPSRQDPEQRPASAAGKPSEPNALFRPRLYYPWPLARHLEPLGHELGCSKQLSPSSNQYLALWWAA